MSETSPIQAVAAVIERDGRFLVGKRNSTKKSAPNYWCPISGQIEPGETEEQAVVREVFEEVGLKTKAVAKVCELETQDKSAIIHWWMLEIICGTAFLKNDEHSEIRWVTLEELQRLSPVYEEDIEIYQQLSRAPTIPPIPDEDELRLETPRLLLEPVTEAHAEELVALFADPELHHFVPFEAPTLETQKERCSRWSKRRSVDGKEIWLNWLAREKKTGAVVAHFQVGFKADLIATIGYVVGRAFQKKGMATEGLENIFLFLRDRLGIKEVKAWTDTRNEASHRLARKLGMVQVDFIKNADFFKGASSDEFVFSKVFDLKSTQG
ncbi:MAG: GNAT family N-acetyltransferase [Bdellovibrionota bacterium]